MRLVFDEWTPDMPALAGGHDKAYNVLPSPQSYRPVADLSAFSSGALNARCQGAAAFRDGSGNVHLFAGTATKLYRITAGSSAFVDVSGATYTTGTDSAWTFAAYNNRAVACDFNDDIQTFLMGTDSAFSALAAGTAPKARYCCVAKNFLMVGNTNDGSDGNVPTRVWWSKQGDITNWPTPGSSAAIAALSGKVDLVGDVGSIQGFFAGLQGADVVVVCERGLFRGLYTGDANVWTFDLIEGARGTPSPGSLVQDGGIGYYQGQDGFYACNGIASQPIGANKVDKFFFSDATYGVNQSYFFRVSAVADPINKAVMFGYPSTSSGGGDIDTILVYNWDIQRFSLITGLSHLDILARIYALGYTLESLDGLSASLDSLAYSLDSRQLTGGNLLIGAVKTDHILYTFTGSNLAATITTTENSHPTNQRMLITEAWPVVEGTSVVPTLTPLTRNRLADTQTTGTSSAMNSVGFCTMRVSARYLELQMDIPAAATWTQAYSIDIPEDKLTTVGNR